MSFGDACSAMDHRQKDCVVNEGIAACRGPITEFPTHLPTCVTHLHIIIDIINKKEFNPIVIASNQPFPKEMNHLEVIEMKLADRSHYEHFTVELNITGGFFTNLPQLRVFQVQCQGRIIFTTNAFHSINTIQTLDFTRTRLLDLTSFIESLDGLRQSLIRSLILKNVQSLSNSGLSTYKSNVDLSQIICPLVASMKHLDLSHNDIIYLTMSSMQDCYVYILDTLDLRYNLITAYFTDSTIVDAYPLYNVLLIGVKVLYFDHMWSDHEADNNLWQDNESIEEGNENQVENQKQDRQEGRDNAGLSSLRGYIEDWLDEMKKYCPSMNPDLFCLLAGFQHVNDDPCSLIACVFPNVSRTCREHSNGTQFGQMVVQVFQEQCSLNHCIGNMFLPFAKTEIYVHHVSGRHSSFGGYAPLDPTTDTTTLCFVPTNSVRIFDISYTQSYGVNQIHENYTTSQFAVTGLHKLKKLNIQSVQFPMRITPLLLSDVPSLEELHMGGNRLTDNESQPLPAAYLHNKPNLKLLNLSHANLPAIEYSAFENSPQLQILDLSYNRLSRDTFLFDLSNTSMTQIRLNDNNLGSILSDMQTQLSSLQNLELDLRNNPLRCDCTTMEFVFWAHQAIQTDHIKFVGSDNYFCVHTVGGSTLFTVDLEAMRMECDAWRKTVLIIGTTLLSATLIVCTIIAVRKRWLIRHFLFTLQEKIQMRKENEQFENYQFDAFVLYSSELSDRKWVHEELVKTMEGTYGFKLCIHLRNFILGEDILDNIEVAIRKSRKVIAVLSPNFADSGWCVDELQMTRTIEQEENRRKLILIQLQDFPNIPANIPPVIRLMLESRTYLEWKEGQKEEKHFWKRLNEALYVKGKLTPGDVRVLYTVSQQVDDQNVQIVQDSQYIEMLSFEDYYKPSQERSQRDTTHTTNTSQTMTASNQRMSLKCGSKPGVSNTYNISGGEAKKKSKDKAPSQVELVQVTSSTSKCTQGKHSFQDTRAFMDPNSGKRKIPETTPEKSPQLKKSNTYI